MLLIAHRGNYNGKTDKENSLKLLLEAAWKGFGVEIDLRKAENGKLIISHDPAEYSKDVDAEHIFKELGNTFVALNIKEEGLLQDLLKIKRNIQGFVFDFELCCSKPQEEIKLYKEAGFKIAKRYSDRNETPIGDYDYVWIDEMDSTNSLDISNLEMCKTIYVSPELHGRSIDDARQDRFFAVCTDNCEHYLQADF